MELRETTRQIEILEPFVSAHKKGLIDQVLEKRTRHLTLVLENILQTQNASAVIRTCECQGIQDIHLIEHSNRCYINPRVVMGAAKWMTVHKYEDDHQSAIHALKAAGYRICATSVSSNATPIELLNITQKTALVFGNEVAGISNEMIADADELVHIPMHGFTESYNLSVSAALCIQTLMPKVYQTEAWQLTQLEKEELRAKWYQSIVRRSDIILKESDKTA
ncbi:MAG: RNA methyltransferase [Cyclobacteriaceae bacterium]